MCSFLVHIPDFWRFFVQNLFTEVKIFQQEVNFVPRISKKQVL